MACPSKLPERASTLTDQLIQGEIDLVKMKIRGGDLDLVEYEFQPFLPGESIHTMGLEKDYKLSQASGKVKVVTPGRIHLTVLDMNRFAPNRPGGGGVGFALQIYCSAEVECTPSDLLHRLFAGTNHSPFCRGLQKDGALSVAVSISRSKITRENTSASDLLDRSSWH